MPQKVKKMKPKRAVDSKEARLRTIAIVMVACLALVIGILIATSPGGDRGSGITAQSSEPAESQESTTPSDSSAPVQTKQTLESVQVPPLSIYRRRNIFKPLVSLEVVEQATTETETATGTGVAVEPYVVLPPELDPGGGNAGSVVSTAITLEGVFEQDGKLFARIRIGEALFEKVAVGEVFGGSYKLLALGRDTRAEILYGDERFTIFAGQSLYW